MTNGMAEKKMDLNEGETEEANHPAHWIKEVKWHINICFLLWDK